MVERVWRRAETVGNDGQESLRLQREETRAVFVIGLLALLLTLKLDPSFSSMFESLKPLNLLILYWGLYVGSAAVGVSSDIIDEQAAKATWEVAHGFFVIGAGMTLAVVVAFLSAVGLRRPVYFESGFRLLGMSIVAGLVVKRSQNLVVSLVQKKTIPRTEKINWAKTIIVDIVGLLPIWFIA